MLADVAERGCHRARRDLPDLGAHRARPVREWQLLAGRVLFSGGLVPLPKPKSSAEALGIMMLQAISEVLEGRVPLTLSVAAAAGQTVQIRISLPVDGEAH